VAGSLPKPSWLAEPEKLWAGWRASGDDLTQAKRDAALVWLKSQEDAGIDIVSDGEQFRIHFVHGFLENIEGIDWNKKTKMGIRDNRYEAEVPTVTGPLRRPRPIHVDDVRFTRAHTRRGEALGVDVIQFDEPAFNVFMNDVKDWGITALEAAAEGLKCKTAVHICYGYGIEANLKWKETLGSEWRQYEAIFPAINASRIDQVSLECQGAKVPVSLIRLLKDKTILTGAIDVATHAVETPEAVAAILAKALKHADAERIQACTNCGMAPLPRAVALGKLEALAAGAELMRSRM
jgi:5-methyltetrahydropteroyltriglutamate--homocysteine methyltransferase